MGNFYSFVQLHDLVQEFIKSLHYLPDYAENKNQVQDNFDVDANISTKYPFTSNFDFITCEHTRDILHSAHKTVTRLEKWDYLRAYTVSKESGFMFTDEPTINELMNEINEDYDSGHSGCSMAFTMRTMDFIAKNGIVAYRKSIVQKLVAEDDAEDDDDEMPSLEPAEDDDDEMPSLIPVEDDEMPSLEPVEDEDEMPSLEPIESGIDDTVSEADTSVTMELCDDYQDSDDDEMPSLIPLPKMHPLDPSFDFMVLYKHEAEYAYQTIQKMEMWNYLYNYSTEEKRGFMFSDDPKIVEIVNQVQKDYGGMHSGGSMALTMRFMELIAKEGFDIFREECIRQKM